jgi:hypothetical protein
MLKCIVEKEIIQHKKKSQDKGIGQLVKACNLRPVFFLHNDRPLYNYRDEQRVKKQDMALNARKSHNNA